MEKWKPVKNFEGYYSISNKGRVKSIKRKNTYKTKGKSYRTDIIGGKILKNLLSSSGYLKVTLYDATRKPKQLMVHRVVAEAFIENTYNKKEVNHINGVKTDNCSNNLEWVTRSENAKHMVDNQMIRYVVGSSNHSCILTYQDAERIRASYKTGKYSQTKLAKEYKCSQATVSQIIRNITYKI